MGQHPLLFGAAAHAGADIHYHECPECHTLPACVEDCTIEPDAGRTPAGNPKGAAVACEACERAKLTPLDVTLARLFAALEAWEPSDDPRDGAVRDVLAALWRAGHLTNAGRPTAESRALLDRARKAGIL